MRLACLLLGCALAVTQARAAGADYLGAAFKYDARQSALAQESSPVFAATGLPGLKPSRTRVSVYRFDGSIEAAFRTIVIPDTADVTRPEPIDHAAAVGLLAKLLPDLASSSFGADWLSRAEAFGQKGGRIAGTRFVVRPEGGLRSLEGARPGDEVTVTIIEGMNPLFDVRTLATVPGTWVRVLELTVVAPDAPRRGAEPGFLEEDAPTAAQLGMALPSGATWLSPDEISSLSDLSLGDRHFLARGTIASLVATFQASDERHCYVESETAMAGPDGSERPITYLWCLTHEGEARTGDDVVSIGLMSAPEDLLHEAGKGTQGSWTVLGVTRWTEE